MHFFQKFLGFIHSRKGKYVIEGKKLSDIESPKAQEHKTSFVSLFEVKFNQAGRRHIAVIS